MNQRKLFKNGKEKRMREWDTQMRYFLKKTYVGWPNHDKHFKNVLHCGKHFHKQNVAPRLKATTSFDLYIVLELEWR